jgi:hypothetical protein
MAVNYAAFAPDFGAILSASPHLRPQQNPFTNALSQQRDIAGALTGTGFTGLFSLESQRLGDQAALERQELANQGALDVAGVNRQINKDVIAANRDSSRRAGLLDMLAGGGGLLGGNNQQQQRFAGPGLNGSPFAPLQEALGGINNVTAGMNNLYGQTVGPWGERGRRAAAAALQGIPRPAVLS